MMQASANKLMWAAALAVASAALAYSAPVAARVAVNIYAPIAPPPLRAERMPPARVGYVWAPGYWAYGRHNYNWRKGHWVRAHRGRHYTPPRWEHEGNRWRYYGDRWDR